MKKKMSRSRASRVLQVSLPALAIIAACQPASAFLPNVTNAMNRLAGMTLFVNPESPAQRQAAEWRASRPDDAALMDRIAAQPVAKWMGNWNRDIQRDVATFAERAARAGATPVFVAYNITNRDCGSYSAGGSASASGYRDWIRKFAAGLSGHTAVVVLEPDAIAGANCLSTSAREERYALLRDAVQTLKAANAVVYLDAGHARWLAPDEAAARLTKAGIAQADGFALNVSNYLSTALNVTYGNQVSQRVGGKHYVIDTSRNGMGGKAGEWCNVPGQALGNPPTTKTGVALADAYLWIKQPGESDGTCGGGPPAGQWWAQYALDLARLQADVIASR